MYLCKKLCVKVSHYHCCCCGCGGIYNRKNRLANHIKTKGDSPSVSTAVSHAVSPPVVCPVVLPREYTISAMIASPVASPVASSHESPVGSPVASLIDIDFPIYGHQKSYTKKVRCPYCDLEVLARNLKVHVEKKHDINLSNNSCTKYAASCVDAAGGIYLVAERQSGVYHPIHGQKYIVASKTPKIFCESKQCQYDKTFAGISGHPTFECVHLRAVYDQPRSPGFNIVNKDKINKYIIYFPVKEVGIRLQGFS